MILIGTSAWIKFLHGTGSPVCDCVEQVLGDEIAVCDAICMEVLSGARDEEHLRNLRRLLARARTVPTGPGDYEEAAALNRLCRRKGKTVRKLIDCLIAAVAIRVGAPVLHLDSDFDVLARHTTLRIDRFRSVDIH